MSIEITANGRTYLVTTEVREGETTSVKVKPVSGDVPSDSIEPSGE